MATKLQQMTELYNDRLALIPQSAENWTAFLRTAAHNHKYSFQDQLSIFSQRPDATACATLDFWNKKLNRWINRGAKGIALIDTRGQETKLSYVFDLRMRLLILF